jgi:hypothetical protein
MSKQGFTGLEIDDYSEKAIVVRGDTKDHNDSLTALGGKWNDRLRDGAGWIFPKTKKADLLAWQKKGVSISGGAPQAFKEQPSAISGSDSRLILSKLNNIEKTLAAIMSAISGKEEEESEEDVTFVPPKQGRLLR